MSAAEDKKNNVQEDEDLQEFKASGEASATADPVGSQTPTRKGDKRTGDPGYYEPEGRKKNKGKSKFSSKDEPDFAKKSKPSMMSDAVKLMGQMDDEELQELLDRLNGEEIEEDVDDDEKVELKKITTDDVDVSEDVNAIFKDDENLTEDFKKQATDIFEAAVVAKVNEILENAYVDAYSDKEAISESVTQDLTEKLDNYLEYVINEWVDENQLAIDKGIHADLAESFMSNLKNVFEEHYIDIPEEKVDVVNELVERNEELEENVNELIESNSDLFKRVKSYEMEKVVDDLSDDLTEAQKDKLRSLAEGINFKSVDDYHSKVSMLKENYFGESDEDIDMTTLNEDNEHPHPVDEEENVPANMAAYTNAIRRHVKGTK